MLQRARDRDEHRVVEVEAEHLALRLHHADHAIALGADPHARTEGIVRAEQLLRGLGPQHDERARLAQVVGRQVLPARDPHAERLGEVRAGAVERDAPAPAGVLDLGVALHDRVGQLHVPRAPERERILDAQGAHRVDRAERHAAGGHAPGRDRDQVGAELRELGDDEAVQALADRREQDHGGDADRDAERRERGAQPVRTERRQDEAHEVVGPHRYRRESARTGSSCAARRAGATANSTAVAIAVSGAATSAHQGGVNGTLG